MANTLRYQPDVVVQGHRAPNNHLGRRHVQRQAGQSGPVTRFVPGTPEYDALMKERRQD